MALTKLHQSDMELMYSMRVRINMVWIGGMDMYLDDQ